MSQSVMIKSNKYGINLVLDPNIPFVELLKDVIEKFKASEKFFKNAELAISFEGRKLSEEEENRIIEAITENTTIQILCIVQNGSEQEAVMKQQIEYYQAVQQQFMNANTGSGDFYRGTLRSGQVIESERNHYRGCESRCEDYLAGEYERKCTCGQRWRPQLFYFCA